MKSFRNGSILGDFILGFTRYQNVTRLNSFLNRTIVNKDLFGGRILSMYFNSSTTVDMNNSTDYDTDYDATDVGSSSAVDQNLLVNAPIQQISNDNVYSSTETQLPKTDTIPNPGLSINKIIINNNSNASLNANKTFKFILIPALKNSNHSSVFTQDIRMVSSHLRNIQLADAKIITIHNRTSNNTDGII